MNFFQQFSDEWSESSIQGKLHASIALGVLSLIVGGFIFFGVDSVTDGVHLEFRGYVRTELEATQLCPKDAVAVSKPIYNPAKGWGVNCTVSD